MTTYWLSPIINDFQFFDNNGNVAAGYYIQQYESGSFSVKQTTYSDNIGTENSNPIQLNSSGRSTPIWLDSSKSYNLVLTADYDGTQIIKNIDNVTGVPIIVGSDAGSANIWINEGTPTYVSATQFLLVGNYTTQFNAGNRFQIQNSDGTYQYGTVLSNEFTGGNTYVNVANDQTTLSPLMTNVWYSVNVAYIQGATVDAGGVSYTTGINYTTSGTVGYKLTQAATAIANQATDIAGLYINWTTTGGPTSYILSPTPASLGNTENQSYNVVFNTNSSGTATLNVSGAGAAELVYLNSSGGYQPATVYASQVSTVLYNGTYWVVQNQLPSPPTVLGSAYWSFFNPPNVGAGTNIIINYGSSTVSPVGITSYSSGQLTIATTGLYDIEASYVGQPQDGVGTVSIFVNGSSTGVQSSGNLFNNARGYFNLVVGGLFSLNSGDVVTIRWTCVDGGISGSGFFKGYRIA